MLVLPPCKVEGGAPLQTSASLLTYERKSFCLSFYSRLTVRSLGAWTRTPLIWITST